MAAGPLELRATSGVAQIGALLQNSASFPVNPACAATSCSNTQADADADDAPAGSAQPTSSPAGAPAGSAGNITESGVTAYSTQDDSSANQQFNATGAITVDNHVPATSASDDPSAATLGLLAESGRSAGCSPSSLGYQCSQQVADGVTIHYSCGGAGQPGNSCTQNAGLDTTLGSDTSMAHFAIESRQPVRTQRQ